MNHKRKRPKNRRGGCLMCKFWKVNGFATERKEGEKFSDHKRRLSDADIMFFEDRNRIFNSGDHDRM